MSNSESVSRRAVVHAAAWSVPVIAVAAAAPAAAASGGLGLIDILIDEPNVSAWYATDVWVFVQVDGVPVSAGTLAVTFPGGSFDPLATASPIEDGWALLPGLQSVHPATGPVTVLARVATADGYGNSSFQLTIDPVLRLYVTVDSSAVDTAQGDPIVTIGGANSATYWRSPGFTWRMGPRTMIQPVTDNNAVITLDDVTGRIIPSTLPGVGFNFLSDAFFPMGAGTYGAGEFELNATRRGYSATFAVPYEISDRALTVSGLTFDNFAPVLVARFTPDVPANQRERIPVGASVTVADQSGQFEPITETFTLDTDGRFQPVWVRKPGMTGAASGTALFTIVNGGYTKLVTVDYTIPA